MPLPDPSAVYTAPCPTGGQPALWAYEPPLEGCLCYCLCQSLTLAWTFGRSVGPAARPAARGAGRHTPGPPGAGFADSAPPTCAPECAPRSTCQRFNLVLY